MLQDKAEAKGIGRNRTGITTHPEQSRELIAAARNAEPSSPGDAGTLAAQRLSWAREKAPGGVGSLPPIPAESVTTDGTARLALGQFLDKLGERLHFERSGVRLYEALLTKRRQYGEDGREASDGGAALPPLAELIKIRDDEQSHFLLLQKALFDLGADPTVITPCADIVSIINQGLPKVLTDPRTDVAQGLQAILMAELQDNDGWRMLIALAQRIAPDLVPAMRDALRVEDTHLEQVRTWLFQLTTQPAVLP